MTEREKLIELLHDATFGVNKHTLADYLEKETVEAVADYLLANGVIVPPCKVGQKVWCILNRTMPVEFQIAIMTMSENRYSFTIETKNGVHKHYCDKDSVGKWVFFTRKEAEKALERSRG